MTASVASTLLLVTVGAGPNPADARALCDAILAERIEATVAIGAGGEQGMTLPCSPDFTDAEITHVVLAGITAMHAVD